MSYKGQQMQCDGDTNGYPYNICTCSPAPSPVQSGDGSFKSPYFLAAIVLALITVLLS